ncbi:hypothetical protein [Bradyrhizobium genosp. A]|uniref:hypothetical protein n=1 Tax=Bradyrhizobium genosp. A TaxID=83626 RepID=UPI003CF81E28
MMSLSHFNAIAAARGDGLDPKLRALLERAAVSPHSEVMVRSDGMLQAGPNPGSEEVERLSAVVVELQQLLAPRAR